MLISTRIQVRLAKRHTASPSLSPTMGSTPCLTPAAYSFLPVVAMEGQAMVATWLVYSHSRCQKVVPASRACFPCSRQHPRTLPRGHLHAILLAAAALCCLGRRVFSTYTAGEDRPRASVPDSEMPCYATATTLCHLYWPVGHKPPGSVGLAPKWHDWGSLRLARVGKKLSAHSPFFASLG